MLSQLPFIKVEQDGYTYHGELRKGIFDNYLFCQGGTIKIKEDAVITEIKQDPPPTESRYSTKEPDTQFEIWQKLKYNNFIEQSEDLSDELRQWHWY